MQVRQRGFPVGRSRRVGGRNALVVVYLLALTGALTAACGGEEPAGDASEASAPESRHNQADVGFAQDMLVHHAQALDMVELTDGRPLEPDVRRLASDIEAAQAPEIETFTDWLEMWDERVPHAGMDGMDGMQGTEDMEGSDHDMPGMMTSGQMDRLTEVSDEEFQSAWLELMIEHHCHRKSVRGGVSTVGDDADHGVLLGPARETFRRRLTGRGYRPEAQIVAARLGKEAGLIGAADLARKDAGS